MPIIIFYLPERASINHGVLLVPARAFFAFVGRNGHAAELDAFDSAPRFFLPLKDRDSVEAGLFERLKEQVLAECPGNTAAPELGILLQFRRNVLVADDIGYDCSSPATQHAEDLGEQLLFVLWANEIQDAVRDDDVDGAIWDKWPRTLKFLDLGFESTQFLSGVNWALF